MKIAIVGTRGIPNRYGGFEQFAEKVSSTLADRGTRSRSIAANLSPRLTTCTTAACGG